VAHLLGAKDLSIDYPTRTVLDNVTIGVNSGDRIGVVGRNGEGKSTLIRALAGVQEPDSGEVIARNSIRVGLLDQDDLFPDSVSVAEAVVGTRPEHEWASDPKIRDVITGLLSDVDWSARIGELSGGQSRRVSLASLLVGEWDVLFLDEPTNHLDVLGVSWLSDHLARRWPTGTGALVVITHDRWFLDASTVNTWEVHDGIVDAYEGGYAAYVLQRVERERSTAVTETKRQNLLKKELAWLRRGAPARTAKPKFRIKEANALINDVPEIRDPVSLSSVATTRLGRKVIDLDDVSVSYGDTTVLHPLSWRLAPGERTGILGANGVGKSTLLGLISGVVEPSSGSISRGTTVKLSVLDQKLDSLAAVRGDRVSEVIARKKTSYRADGVEMTPGQLLERLGFSSAHLAARVFELSGGQRRRLQFLMELLEEPNVLLLDEPTNDLDTEMLRAMEDLLDTWPGTLIVVSHDRYLLERVTDQQYAIIDGHFRHLPGGVDEYVAMAHTTSTRALSDLATTPSGNQSDGPTTVTTLRPGSKEHREAEKDKKSTERKIAAAQETIAAVDAELGTTDPTDFTTLTDLDDRRKSAQRELEALEERWLELVEKLR